MSLRTDYKDDVFTGNRKYRMIDNGDGTVSFEDATTYEQEGDTYGAAQINAQNTILNGLDGSVYKAEDDAETEIADGDYFPFYDTSAETSRKSLWSNIVDKLKVVLAIKEHSSNTAATYGAGTSSKYGHVKVSDNYINGTGTADNSVAISEYAATTAFQSVSRRLLSANASPSGMIPTNTKSFTFDYKNGKYGWNEKTDRTGTFHPFKEPGTFVYCVSGNVTLTDSAPTGLWKVRTYYYSFGLYHPTISIKINGTQVYSYTGIYDPRQTTDAPAFTYSDGEFTISTSGTMTVECTPRGGMIGMEAVIYKVEE